MDSLLQKIKPKMPRCSSLVIYSSETRTIPFTVPSSALPYGGPGWAPGGGAAGGGAAGGGAAGARRCDSLGESGRSSSCDSQPGTPPTHHDSRAACRSPLSDMRGTLSIGSIDPSLYRNIDVVDDNYDIPPGHLGRIWFAVEYQGETEKLHVTLIKARHLPSRSQSSSTACDPFFRITVLPDERRYLQTKFKKKTCNPKFEESFVFPISKQTLDERVLKFTGYDVDRNRRHQLLGYALYQLKEQSVSSNERIIVWRNLEKEMAETTLEKGELNMSLCYNDNMERLTVGVFDGKNMASDRNGSVPARTKGHDQSLRDFYLKVCLMQQSKVIKAKKTEVVKKTNHPAFNESFIFKVRPDDLESVSISITAMQSNTAHRDTQVGRITLGSFMFARGKELEHWNEMTNTMREPITQCHTFT